MSRYFDDELCHSWGNTPKEKAAEKRYNHWYYLNKIKKFSKDAIDNTTGEADKEEAEQHKKLADLYANYATLASQESTGVYQGHDTKYWEKASMDEKIKVGNSRTEAYKKSLPGRTTKLDELQNASFTKLETELKSQGSGARGILVVGWPANYKDFRKRTSYFHAMNYMVDKDNKVTLYDGQIDNTGNIDRFFIDADPRELMYMRTDNLELDPSVTDMVISRKKASQEML